VITAPLPPGEGASATPVPTGTAMPPTSTDTIIAIATAPGQGGIGILRLSGPDAFRIATHLGCPPLRPRHARYTHFQGADGSTIDDGIALYFPAPHSYTGEDVIELQGHGSPVLLQQLTARCLDLGARLARPGEFSERAFLNGRLDLTQAEAIADLIAAGDLHAARAARRSLEGVFSRRVNAIAAELLNVRVHIEAMIDFVDEPIETLGADQVRQRLASIADSLNTLLRGAEHGRKLRDGLHAVIIGPPNAGKSSLLNALTGSDRAIVTATPGTTRDLLTETIRIDGIELTLVDTAGLREGGDAIEREGMRRAEAELTRADLALIVLDATDPSRGLPDIITAIETVHERLWLLNKTDLAPDALLPPELATHKPLHLSAHTGHGLDALRARLTALAQHHSPTGTFSARQRHITALTHTREHFMQARITWEHGALDLTAEHLRLAHDTLGEITGRVLPDDLLGAVFSTFCIGK